jgi:hypothetical protein
MDAARATLLLCALEDPDLRARRAAELLRSLTPVAAAELLAGLVEASGRRRTPAALALEGMVRALRSELSAQEQEPLRAAAAEAGLRQAEALLTAKDAPRSFDHDREQWIDREMQARTLGMRKQLARLHDRDVLARLATDQDPAVLRNLLENPRLTEREVLVAASRRPARPAALEEIFRSKRFGNNRRVRRALALNPYSPPSLGAAALTLLTAPDLREVMRDGHLATEVRAHARRLLAQRLGKDEAELLPLPPPLPSTAPEEPPEEELAPEEEALLVAQAEALLRASTGRKR